MATLTKVPTLSVVAESPPSEHPTNEDQAHGNGSHKNMTMIILGPTALSWQGFRVACGIPSHLGSLTRVDISKKCFLYSIARLDSLDYSMIRIIYIYIYIFVF